MNHVLILEVIMKCPNCEYEDMYAGDTVAVDQGAYGDFFTQDMSRHEKHCFMGTDTIKIVGCPKCLHIFMSRERY
jgi:hypothetical protein